MYSLDELKQNLKQCTYKYTMRNKWCAINRPVAYELPSPVVINRCLVNSLLCSPTL